MGWLSPSSWLKKFIKLLHIISYWELIDPNSRAGRALRDTKLSGVKEAMKPKISFYRQIFFWGCFTTCLAYGVVGCVGTVQKYIDDPTFKSLHEGISIENGFNPSLTINRLYHYDLAIIKEAKVLNRDTEAEDNAKDSTGIVWNGTEANQLNDMMHHNCQNKRSVAVRFNVTHTDQTFHKTKYEKNPVDLKDDPNDPVYKHKIIPFMLRGMVKCSEIIGACIINGIPMKECAKFFRPVQTEIGLACSTNQMPDSILRRDAGIKTFLRNTNNTLDNATDELWKTFNMDSYPFRDNEKRKTDPHVKGNIPSRTKIAGLENGHTQVIKFKKNDMPGCPTFDSDGYLISVGSPHEAPQPTSNGILVQRNMEIFIKTTVQITLADREMIEHVSIEKRECLLQHESTLKHHTVYSEQNCQQECLAISISNTCQCWELTSTSGRNETLCGRAQQQCVDNVRVNFAKNGYAKECEKENMTCYPACNQVKYSTTVSSAPLRKNNFADAEALGVDMETEDFSIVHHYIEHQEMEAYEIVLYSNFHELFASLGGILGLSNGIDIIGIVNILMGFLTLIMMFLELIYLLVTMGCAAEAFVICYNKNCVAPPPELPEQEPSPVDKKDEDEDEDDEEDENENAITEQPTSSGSGPSNPPNSNNRRRVRPRRAPRPPPPQSPSNSTNNERRPLNPEDTATGLAITPEADEPILQEDNEDSTEDANASGEHSSQTDCFSRLLPTDFHRSSQPANTDPRNNVRKPKRPFNSAQAKFKSPGPITQQPKSNRNMKSAPISSARFTNKVLPKSKHQKRPQTSGNPSDLSRPLLPKKIDLDERDRISCPTDFPRQNFPSETRRFSLPNITESTFTSKRQRPFNSAQAKPNMLAGSVQLNASTLVQPFDSRSNQIAPTRFDYGHDEPRNVFWIRSASQRPDHVSFQIEDEESGFGLRDYEDGRQNTGGAIAYQETVIDASLGDINSDISSISQRVRTINRTVHRWHQD